MQFWELFSHRGMKTVWRTFIAYMFGKSGRRRVHGLRLFYHLRLLVMLRSTEQVSRIARRSEVKIWVDGNEAFIRLERLIRHAKHTIIIQMFIWKDDATGKHIASLLIDAANRGVKVDIAKDSTGDVFEFKQDFLTTQKNKSGVWHTFWKHPNIKISYDNLQDHSKVFIFDDQILLLTGMNIADEYRNDWHDYLVELRGSGFVEDYLTGESINRKSHVLLRMNKEDRKEIRNTIHQLLTQAHSFIVAEYCYVSDLQVIKLLAKRTHDGVRVTLILPRKTDLHNSANMQAVQYLLTHANTKNLQVFLYPRIVHGKVLLVDRSIAFIGSANLMKSSLDDMGELNVLIEGKHKSAVRKLRSVLRSDILQSEALLSPPRLHAIGRWLAWIGL